MQMFDRLQRDSKVAKFGDNQCQTYARLFNLEPPGFGGNPKFALYSLKITIGISSMVLLWSLHLKEFFRRHARGTGERSHQSHGKCTFVHLQLRSYS